MTGRPPEDRIAAIRREDLDACADFLFRCYSDLPEFAALFGFATAAELDGCRPIFAGICALGAQSDGVAIGCYRQGELVGAAICKPILDRAWRPGLSLLWLIASLRYRLRYRPKLPPAARWRLHVYDWLARRQCPHTPHLHVLALGVSPGARRNGIAGALLRFIANDDRWRGQTTHIVADTWCETNAAIYKRLGFETVAQSQAEGVRVWTMTAPLAADS